MSEAPIKATLKAGRDYDAPWLTVDAFDPEDLETKLNALASGKALEAVVNAANVLKAVNNAAPIAAEVASPPAPQVAPAAPPQQQQVTPAGWGQSTEPIPSWAAQSAQPQQQAPAAPGAALHPEGEACACGQVLQFKQVNRKSDGKQFKFWECPSRTGKNDTVHVSKFAN